MKRLLQVAAAGLTSLTIFGAPLSSVSAGPAKPAFPITKQTAPQKTSHEFLTMTVRIGAEPILMLPFDIASATYTDSDIAVPRPIAANRIAIVGKKVGKMEVILQVKGTPERLFTIKVSVEETPPPAKRPVRASDSRVTYSGPAPYKKPYPVKEVAEMLTDTRARKTIEIGIENSRILDFDVDIIEVVHSVGGQIGVAAIAPRSVAIIGKSLGEAQLLIRTRRSPSDQTGQTEQFKITVVKAAPNSVGAWKEREKELKAEIEKRDERIRELERQLAEKKL